MEFKVYLLVFTFVGMFTQSISTPPERRSLDDKINHIIEEFEGIANVIVYKMRRVQKSLNELGRFSEEQKNAAERERRVSSIV